MIPRSITFKTGRRRSRKKSKNNESKVYGILGIKSTGNKRAWKSMYDLVKKALLKITLIKFNSKLVNWKYGKVYKGVGKVIDLKINFKEKRLNCSLKLNGEAENITVTATGFKLAKNGSKHYIKISSAQINREWLETLANKLVVGKEIEIPEEVYETITGMFGK